MLKGHEFVYFGSLMRGRLNLSEKKNRGVQTRVTRNVRGAYELKIFKFDQFTTKSDLNRFAFTATDHDHHLNVVGTLKTLSKYSKCPRNIKDKRQTPFKDEYGFVREQTVQKKGSRLEGQVASYSHDQN